MRDRFRPLLFGPLVQPKEGATSHQLTGCLGCSDRNAIQPAGLVPISGGLALAHRSSFPAGLLVRSTPFPHTKQRSPGT